MLCTIIMITIHSQSVQWYFLKCLLFIFLYLKPLIISENKRDSNYGGQLLPGEGNAIA